MSEYTLGRNLKSVTFATKFLEQTLHCLLTGESTQVNVTLDPRKLDLSQRIKPLHLTDVRPHMCPVCGKGFKTGKDLREHKAIHSDERPFPCRHEGCQQAFKTKRTRSRQESEIHGKGRKEGFKCATCDKILTTRQVFVIMVVEIFSVHWWRLEKEVREREGRLGSGRVA